MFKEDDLYNQLAFYTFAHPDPSFIHQHVVDSHTAQNADEQTKPIALVFALIGLYLHLERGYIGKQVQRVHMQLAKQSKTWPKLPIPTGCGDIRIDDVLASDPGPARDTMIERWCESVWRTWTATRPAIVAIAREHLGID